MALAKKCDRCGNFYDHYPINGSASYNSIKFTLIDRSGSVLSGSRPMDLCPECMGKLEVFFNLKKKEGNDD